MKVFIVMSPILGSNDDTIRELSDGRQCVYSTREKAENFIKAMDDIDATVLECEVF